MNLPNKTPLKRIRFANFALINGLNKPSDGCPWISGMTVRSKLTNARLKVGSVMVVWTFPSTTDITAFVLVFPPTDEDDKFMVLPYFWIPEESLDLRVKRDHVPYDVWKRQGYLQTTEGNVVHYGFIEKFIEELGLKYNIREIAFDRWGAVQMVQNLEGMGFTVAPFGQGFKDMSPPTKELMKLTLEQKLAHGGHPHLTLDDGQYLY